MSDEDQGTGQGEEDDATRRARLQALEHRLSERRARDAVPPPRSGRGYSGGELAYRMVIELVSGLLIGLGIGYGLDTLFGTMPIFLVLFTFLGFAAGINVMLKTAKQIKLGDEPPEDEEGR